MCAARRRMTIACDMNCMQDATAQLQQVLAKDPKSGHAWHTLGQMAEETGDLQEALRCYSEGTHSSGLP